MNFVRVVDSAGVTWEVADRYFPCVGIGEAADLAAQNGCELPSPELVDAIWQHADAKLLPLPRRHDGTPRTMASPEVFADQQRRIDEQLTAEVEPLLVAGCFKDVVVSNGKLGLYGWHVAREEADAFKRRSGVPLHLPRTPIAALVVQPFFAGHARSWKDYSQGARLVRRVSEPR